MESLFQDLRFAIRTLLKRPSFTLVAVGSLALGIAANATVFSWIERILLRPVAGVPESSRIVTVKTVAPNGDLLDSSYPDFRDFRDQAKVFHGVVAFRMVPLYLGDVPNTERVWSELVSGNFFDVLGVKPIAGRTFSAEEQADRPGGAPVAVISENMWRRRYHADPGVLGRSIRLNQRALTIIGVVPADFTGTVNGLEFDLYVPVMMQAELTGSWEWLSDRGSRPLDMMARLAPGVSVEQARAAVVTIASRLATEYPQTNRNLGGAVLPVADSPNGVQAILGKLLKVLLLVASAVLLIVCANVGNLLLVRAAGRQKEFGIRISLGASRSRLMAQLLTEAVVLAVTGSLLGLVATLWMTRGIDMFLPPSDLPIANLGGRLDVWGVLFTGVLTMLTAMACAIVPAWHLFGGPQRALRETSRGVSSGRAAKALRAAFVVCELSLALVAIVGSGMFIRSFQNAKSANPGFDPDHVLLAGIDLSQARYPAEQARTLLRRLRDGLKQVRGVEAVGLAEDIPLGFAGGSWEEIQVNGYVPRAGENMKLWRNIISPGYFETLKIPLVSGRDFDERDVRGTERVAIVNETFVRRFFSGAPAVGRKFHAWGEDITIVGVARDSKYRQLAESPLPYFYIPFAQLRNPNGSLGVAVRTVERPEAFTERLRAELKAIDPNIAIAGIAPYTSYMSASYFAQKVGASLLSVLGLISLTLAALGLYGVMAYSVAQRTQEIGIRMALGARPGQVLQLTIFEGLKLCGIGAAAGLMLAFVFNRLAASALYGINGIDYATYAGATLVLLLCAVAATLLPALRAARIDPVTALRWE